MKMNINYKVFLGGLTGLALLFAFIILGSGGREVDAQTGAVGLDGPKALDYFSGLGDGNTNAGVAGGHGDGSTNYYAGLPNYAGDGNTNAGVAGGHGDGSQYATGDVKDRFEDLLRGGDCSVYCYVFPLRAIAFPSQSRLAGVRFCSETVTTFCRERLGLNRSSGNISLIYNEMGDALRFIESVVKNIQENN